MDQDEACVESYFLVDVHKYEFKLDHTLLIKKVVLEAFLTEARRLNQFEHIGTGKVFYNCVIFFCIFGLDFKKLKNAFPFSGVRDSIFEDF